MSRSLAFLVVALLLCIVLSSQADGLQCTGERLRNGTFFFNASYEVKEGVHDCETQWLIGEKLAGLFEADGNTEILPPIIMVTANTAMIQTCPETLQCLLLCPSGNINQKNQCLCDTTPPTTLPEGDTTPPTTLPEVGFPNFSIGVLIGSVFGVMVFVILILIVTFVLCRKARMVERSGSAASSSGSVAGSPGSAEDVPFKACIEDV